MFRIGDECCVPTSRMCSGHTCRICSRNWKMFLLAAADLLWAPLQISGTNLHLPAIVSRVGNIRAGNEPSRSLKFCNNGCLKAPTCASSRCFQPGEGSSRGLLHDLVSSRFANVRFQLSSQYAAECAEKIPALDLVQKCNKNEGISLH